MKSLVAVLTFASVYGICAEMANWVRVYCFDEWDRKFHTREGSIRVFHDALPVLVGLACLVFLLGWQFNRPAANHMRIRLIAATAALSAVLANGLLLVCNTLAILPGLGAVGFLTGQVAFWSGPAFSAIVAFRVVRRLSQ